MIKKIIALITTIILGLTLISCNTKKFDITTTLYPSYDIAKNIVGDKLTVSLLVSPGAEVHDFEPSSRQIELIRNSKLFIFTSYEMDTWLNNNVESIIGNTKALNLFSGVNPELYEHDDHLDGHDHDHDHGDELHFWVDPIIYISLIDYVLKQIILIDPANQSYYETNASNYQQKLLNLDEQLTSFLSNLNNPTIYFAGHNALGLFASRYHLEIHALSNTNKPDADLTSNQILNLVNEIKIANINYLFTEELKEPKIANTIKRDLLKENIELTLLEFHGYHNVTKADFDNHVTYYDLLLRNYNHLKKALGN